MRRVTALFAAALFLGAHGLVPMLPQAPGGKASCSGKMACCTGPGGCSVSAACEAPATAACHAKAGTAASGPDGDTLPCLRALGCGHSSPSVVTPHLDPALFAARVLLSAELAPTSLQASAQPLPSLLSEEPLSPPPRV